VQLVSTRQSRSQSNATTLWYYPSHRLWPEKQKGSQNTTLLRYYTLQIIRLWVYIMFILLSTRWYIFYEYCRNARMRREFRLCFKMLWQSKIRFWLLMRHENRRNRRCELPCNIVRDKRQTGCVREVCCTIYKRAAHTVAYEHDWHKHNCISSVFFFSFWNQHIFIYLSYNY